ncbi:hypothetical protein [Methylocystis echinoides]|uniref:Uncharacterized protein n=1 Tax=Methylocystis echinoides TaxID=29468 RepID=A0A9W6GYN2_9HYPH|nr:hypothetical protein [Methylocystis echinoides]GLI95403.1 hypothetical protein LMG27198_43950 [Methylocystis echinoides]
MHNFFRTLAPERFEADVVIHADGSYAYSYDGALIFTPALIQACHAGCLDPQFEVRLKNAATQLLSEGFAEASYVGRGRYRVILRRAVADGRPSYFPSREMTIFTIRPRHDGAILVMGSRPDATAPCQLIGTDAEIDGRLTVTLDPGIEVISQNAQSKLPTFDARSRYHWRIKSPDADPFIIVKPT